MNHKVLVQELAEHLRRLPVAGLPAAWFDRGEIIAPAETVEALPEVRPPDEPRIIELALSEGNQTSAADWEHLRAMAMSCRKCRLCETRKNVVFGVGNTARPKIVFVGEGPGADEDRQGEPFVGKAGMLLNAAITKGLGLQRSDVYICNVVKCRPPENRTPLPDEVASCSPYLFRQLELLEPQVIVALGGPAQQTLTGAAGGITRLRGKWMAWRGIKVMPTFHPAYILRNPAAKKDFWDDLQEVMREVGLPAPAAKGAREQEMN